MTFSTKLGVNMDIDQLNVQELNELSDRISSKIAEKKDLSRKMTKKELQKLRRELLSLTKKGKLEISFTCKLAIDFVVTASTQYVDDGTYIDISKATITSSNKRVSGFIDGITDHIYEINPLYDELYKGPVEKVDREIQKGLVDFNKKIEKRAKELGLEANDILEKIL